MNKKDYQLSFLAGALLGALMMPILKIAKPDLYSSIYLFVIPFFLVVVPAGMIVANLIGKKISFVWQVAKFGVTGVINTLVDWGVLALLITIFNNSFKIQPDNAIFTIGALIISYYLVYKSISFLVAVINSYLWNKFWTFSDGVKHKTATEFTQFLIVSVIGFVINIGISGYIFSAIKPFDSLTVDQWGIIGAAVGSVAGLAWNFVGYKFFVFKESKLESEVKN